MAAVISYETWQNDYTGDRSVIGARQRAFTVIAFPARRLTSICQ
jgi:hypothetical protein